METPPGGFPAIKSRKAMQADYSEEASSQSSPTAPPDLRGAQPARF